ncbi:PAX3- and PAX7-binding protein 1-like [Rana temporaria]|uniref:PAX3- and PAX7-binding protein 1-like n=1 Tax=Rana temporaria TaxID=8407 RepID=UPI001AAD11C2|nr:PAX3- and PAX7-binding protein 1-like [Rana temporaria]
MGVVYPDSLSHRTGSRNITQNLEKENKPLPQTFALKHGYTDQFLLNKVWLPESPSGPGAQRAARRASSSLPPPSFPHTDGGGFQADPRAREPKSKLLSFQDDEEEEEVFKIKKSNHSKKIVKLLKKEFKEDKVKTKPKSDVLLGLDGEIPDAAFIHAARKKRQLARELRDVPSLDVDGGKRLVREDENDASDDDDDDEKRRIVFSVREKSQRQKIAEESGIEGSDDEALATGEQDEEISRWEQEQIRKGISIPQVQAPQPAETNNLFYPSTYQGIPYGSAYNVPYTYSAFGSAETKPLKPDNSVSFKTPHNEMTSVTIDLVKNQLKDSPIVVTLKA